MNQKAEQLGLTDTHFTNPHGLHSDEHYTTARDLAVLAAYALENPVFLSIVSTYKKVIPLKETEGSRVLINHNKLLKQYEGSIGVKTGYTKKSGRCLVSAAERDGIRLVSVTLNAPNDWNDHRNMLDYGFSNYESIKLVSQGEFLSDIPVINGTADFVSAKNSSDVIATLKKDAYEITYTLELKRFYYAPIMENEVLGKIIYYDNGEYIGSSDIVAVNSVAEKENSEKNLLDKILRFFRIRT